MTHKSHIPKFGNWDSDNVPYTAWFENARKEESRTMSLPMMNPNDPQQNPEAFDFLIGGGNANYNQTDISNDLVIKASSGDCGFRHNSNSSLGRRSSLKGNQSWRQRSTGSFTRESISDKSNFSDQSVLSRGDNKRALRGGSGSVSCSSSSSGHRRRRTSGSHSSHDFANQKGTPVPKFGAWDERDPNSGEGFTLTFTKIKEEKQTEHYQFPSVPPPPGSFSNMQNQCDKPSFTLSKYCCCLFSRESK